MCLKKILGVSPKIIQIPLIIAILGLYWQPAHFHYFHALRSVRWLCLWFLDQSIGVMSLPFQSHCWQCVQRPDNRRGDFFIGWESGGPAETNPRGDALFAWCFWWSFKSKSLKFRGWNTLERCFASTASTIQSNCRRIGFYCRCSAKPLRLVQDVTCLDGAERQRHSRTHPPTHPRSLSLSHTLSSHTLS